MSQSGGGGAENTFSQLLIVFKKVEGLKPPNPSPLTGLETTANNNNWPFQADCNQKQQNSTSIVTKTRNCRPKIQGQDFRKNMMEGV